MKPVVRAIGVSHTACKDEFSPESSISSQLAWYNFKRYQYIRGRLHQMYRTLPRRRKRASWKKHEKQKSCMLKNKPRRPMQDRLLTSGFCSINRMRLIFHATRRTPHGVLVCLLAQLAMSVWSVKSRRAPSRHFRGARDYGHHDRS